jgi:hypothetical protein
MGGWDGTVVEVGGLGDRKSGLDIDVEYETWVGRLLVALK